MICIMMLLIDDDDDDVDIPLEQARSRGRSCMPPQRQLRNGRPRPRQHKGS